MLYMLFGVWCADGEIDQYLRQLRWQHTHEGVALGPSAVTEGVAIDVLDVSDMANDDTMAVADEHQF